jgi:multidrug efflux system membrane fusion protein
MEAAKFRQIRPLKFQVEPPQLTTIKVATAHLGPIGYYVEALGTVTPQATVNLYSQVNGRVVAVHYVEGQMVHRGDTLIDIDPPPLRSPVEANPGNAPA